MPEQTTTGIGSLPPPSLASMHPFRPSSSASSGGVSNGGTSSSSTSAYPQNAVGANNGLVQGASAGSVQGGSAVGAVGGAAEPRWSAATMQPNSLQNPRLSGLTNQQYSTTPGPTGSTISKQNENSMMMRQQLQQQLNMGGGNTSTTPAVFAGGGNTTMMLQNFRRNQLSQQQQAKQHTTATAGTIQTIQQQNSTWTTNQTTSHNQQNWPPHVQQQWGMQQMQMWGGHQHNAGAGGGPQQFGANKGGVGGAEMGAGWSRGGGMEANKGGAASSSSSGHHSKGAFGASSSSSVGTVQPSSGWKGHWHSNYNNTGKSGPPVLTVDQMQQEQIRRQQQSNKQQPAKFRTDKEFHDTFKVATDWQAKRAARAQDIANEGGRVRDIEILSLAHKFHGAGASGYDTIDEKTKLTIRNRMDGEKELLYRTVGRIGNMYGSLYTGRPFFC